MVTLSSIEYLIILVIIKKFRLSHACMSTTFFMFFMIFVSSFIHFAHNSNAISESYLGMENILIIMTVNLLDRDSATVCIQVQVSLYSLRT